MNSPDWDVIGGVVMAAGGFTTIALLMAIAAIRELHQRHTRNRKDTNR
ncbi:hypothetical protein Bra3105_17875 [Brachybacterium halotolerans subsp. kimchii]|nr:hypothetical protein [Brachybacterium halotolerans]UEJ82671.1 hypothetical protein Bra3105_17875 [Brachybacterium halotolerans subsp. kimchii]